MKGFFWAVVAIYLLLYFYAVYLYEGFSLLSALGILIIIGVVSWLLFRGWTSKNDNTDKRKQGTVEMRWFQSPFPYLLILIALALLGYWSR